MVEATKLGQGVELGCCCRCRIGNRFLSSDTKRGPSDMRGMRMRRTLVDGFNAPSSERLDYFQLRQRKTHHEHDHDQGRHADPLRRLGERTTRGLQSWLAALRRRVRRPDVL